MLESSMGMGWCERYKGTKNITHLHPLLVVKKILRGRTHQGRLGSPRSKVGYICLWTSIGDLPWSDLPWSMVWVVVCEPVVWQIIHITLHPVFLKDSFVPFHNFSYSTQIGNLSSRSECIWQCIISTDRECIRLYRYPRSTNNHQLFTRTSV